ncbi:DUF2946 family protein [Vogesella sp. AC12]|uniref:DUF2946 family protein n=1 Tax=Vogesella sp. AC12 TaxID=2950550 RepID=UPI00210E4850|nr:DUF2946 family protein [Vogesella sp. AC12]MCQ4146044.1 DUF2946 family protein [Vogesella sp. AC12]
MDAMVLASLAKWPNVPAVFGWLRLDARGQWWLREERLNQAAIVDFFRRNYARDGDGRYYVQNGPQKVYVALDAAPYVVRRGEAGWQWLPDIDPGTPRLALLDEGGRLFVEAGGELAVVDDRELLALSEVMLRSADGLPPTAADWTAWQQGTLALQLCLVEGSLPLRPLAAADVSRRYGVVLSPQP